MKEAPKVPTERELLQAETNDLSRRQTEAYEEIAALERRLEAIDADAGAAAVRGDARTLAVLEAELDVAPVKLRLAKAKAHGISEALDAKAARLGELNREVVISRLDAQRTELVTRGEQSAAALSAMYLEAGRLVAERVRLCDEMDALKRTLVGYDINIPPLPDFRAVAETTFAAARNAGRVEPVEVRVPVPA